MVEPRVPDPDSGGGDGGGGGGNGDGDSGGDGDRRSGDGGSGGGGGDGGGGDGGGGDGVGEGVVELPCGETVGVQAFDMGMREYECACGAAHAVVMDMHPPSRWLPESVVAVLREAVEPAEDDDFEEFGTPHLVGAVLEERPGEVVVEDQSGNGAVGYALLWVCDFDARTLHEHIVELVVELMDHAASHGDEGAASELESQMSQFDVEEFVERYRAERDFEDEYDTAA